MVCHELKAEVGQYKVQMLRTQTVCTVLLSCLRPAYRLYSDTTPHPTLEPSHPHRAWCVLPGVEMRRQASLRGFCFLQQPRPTQEHGGQGD